MCENRSGYQGLSYAAANDDVCARFRQAIDVPVLPAGVRAIPLTRGKFALVDESDYAALIKHSWYAQRNYDGVQESFYAVGKIKGRTVQMHRQILSARPGLVVDHINRNGLDNRRCNLRLCSQAENVRNTRSRRGSSSRYKGVSYLRQRGNRRICVFKQGRRSFQLRGIPCESQ